MKLCLFSEDLQAGRQHEKNTTVYLFYYVKRGKH